MSQPKSPANRSKKYKIIKLIGQLSGITLLLVLAVIIWWSKSRQPDVERTFAQFSGFADYFATHPPLETPPTAEEQALLQRFRPRFFLPPEHSAPIDFYRDYIAQGRLLDSQGKVLSTQVTPELLNRYRDTPGMQFVHEEQDIKSNSVVYARIDYDNLKLEQENQLNEYAFTFLTYHLVFRESGLPAGTPGWQLKLLGLVAPIDDWHQLDHYTALTIALDEQQQPVAITMQQHNYLTTYLIGAQISWPEDNRITIDVAMSSNELYPHQPGRVKRLAASFLNAESAHYVTTGQDKPLMAAEDITYGIEEVNYTLEFLPQTDAFYMFQGRLGELRSLPGRDGPPGSEYNVLPAIKPRALGMVYGYRGQNAQEYVDLIAATQAPMFAGQLSDELIQAWCARFIKDWQSHRNLRKNIQS